MKRLCLIAALCLSAALLHINGGSEHLHAKTGRTGPELTAQAADTSSLASLDARLGEYLEAIKAEPAEMQKREADFLIELCSDSLIRHRTALKLYRHYVSSPVMGLDAVAIHIYDKWFATGQIKMDDESELYAAKLFAGINRNSLIGCRARPMLLQDKDGNSVTVMGPDDKGWRVIFFYDTGCPKCKLESIMLKGMFGNRSYPVTLYAVYTGTDKRAWEEYMEERLDFDAPGTRVVHLWDPDLTGDIGYGYGVFQTPRMFLADPRGIIVGRGLDTPALERLLNALLPQKEYEYGSDASKALYDKVFAPLKGAMPETAISDIAGHIEKSTLEQGDTSLFKQMTGDLLYYITDKIEEEFKNSTGDFLDNYILSREDIWNTPDDSLKIVGLASMLKSLVSLAPTGSRLPEIKVHGILKTSRAGKAEVSRTPKVRTGEFLLSRLHGRGRTVVIFHTEGCRICERELAAADTLLGTEKNLKVLEINMDEAFSSYPSEAEALIMNFDLSSLPFIMELDKKGRVARKYISL